MGWLALVLVLCTACEQSDESQQSEQALAAIEPAPRGPEVSGSQYEAIELNADPAHGATNTEAAVSGAAVFFYGGASPVPGDESGGLLARGDGTLLNLQTEELVDVRAWPYANPPNDPEVVAIGDVFLVVGTPCAVIAPADGHPDCGDVVRAALFDPVRMRWQPVSVPSEQLQLAEGSYVEMFALGVTDDIAFFVYQVDNQNDSQVVGFDRSRSSWRHFGPFVGSPTTHCATTAGMLRSYVSPTGGLITERLDLDTSEWRSTIDGQSSDLQAPDQPVVLSSDDPITPDLVCAGDQLLTLAPGGGATEEMYWFSEATAEWVEIPAMAVQTGSYMSAARIHDVLALWPSGGTGNAQALSAGTWIPLDGAPPLNQPQLVRTGDELITIGRERTANGSTAFTIGRLTLELK